MYAHTAWLYAYPYAVRTWGQADWVAYIDWLASQSFNLLQIWIPVGIMATPPDASDQDWLAMMQTVSDYAQTAWGFMVWVGEAANNVVDDVQGVPFSEREYYRYCVGQAVNPADATALQRLWASRCTLYETFPQADGFWMIDSDPGGWPGSPTTDLVQLFRLHAELKARYASAGSRLVYWLWLGWGTAGHEANVSEAVRGLHEVTEGNALLLCPPQDLSQVARLGWSDRTVLTCYGAVEGEPVMPYTRVNPGPVKNAVGMALAAGVQGCVGNAQTPAAQLPQIMVLARYLWAGSEAWDYQRRPLDPVPKWLDGFARDYLGSWASLGGRTLQAIYGRNSANLGALTWPAIAVPAQAPMLDPSRLSRDLAAQYAVLVATTSVADLAAQGSTDSEAWTDAVVAWMRANVAWQKISGWALAENVLEPQTGGLSMVVSGRYLPGRGTYARYLEPVQEAVRTALLAESRALCTRLANLCPPGIDPSVWTGMLADIFGSTASLSMEEPHHDH
jgi:hypothetical protein